MATIFKYNNQIYQCLSLNKKLKRLKINEKDIDILFEGDLSQSELEKKFLELTKDIKKEEIEPDEIKLYYFINPKTGYSITSINEHINNNDYERCSKTYLEEIWSKARKL